METVELNSQTAKHYLHQNLFGQKPVEFDAHLNQWLVNYHQHADAHGHHHHHSDLTSFAIEVQEDLTATQVEQWLEYLINRYGKDLVRYKGFIAVESFEHQLIVQGVHQWFQLDRGRLWEPEEPRGLYWTTPRSRPYQANAVRSNVNRSQIEGNPDEKTKDSNHLLVGRNKRSREFTECNPGARSNNLSGRTGLSSPTSQR